MNKNMKIVLFIGLLVSLLATPMIEADRNFECTYEGHCKVLLVMANTDVNIHLNADVLVRGEDYTMRDRNDFTLMGIRTGSIRVQSHNYEHHVYGITDCMYILMYKPNGTYTFTEIFD